MEVSEPSDGCNTLDGMVQLDSTKMKLSSIGLNPNHRNGHHGSTFLLDFSSP